MNIKSMVLFVALVVALSLTTGCASVAYDYAQNGEVAVETHDTEKGSLHDIKITQIGDETHISGKVTRDQATRLLKGFVKVDIVNEKGVRIDTTESKYMFRRSAGRVSSSGTFDAKLVSPPPKGSKAVLTNHDNRDKIGDDSKGSISIM